MSIAINSLCFAIHSGRLGRAPEDTLLRLGAYLDTCPPSLEPGELTRKRSHTDVRHTIQRASTQASRPANEKSECSGYVFAARVGAWEIRAATFPMQKEKTSVLIRATKTT